MIRKIIEHPDPLLKSICKPLLEITDHTQSNIQDMLDTLYDASGRGLAGPQIGLLIRFFVMDISWKDGVSNPKIMINPEILYESNEKQVNEERCLSIPNKPVKIIRPKFIEVLWMDEKENVKRESFSGVTAAVISHEIDHLDGKLIIDYNR